MTAPFYTVSRVIRCPRNRVNIKMHHTDRNTLRLVKRIHPSEAAI
jgi:hypothetical protein